GQLTKGTTRAEIARAALAAPPAPRNEVTIADIMLEGFSTRIVAGYAAAAPILRRGIAALVATPFTATGISRGSTLGCNAAAPLAEEDLPPHGSQALPEIVEAASRSGHPDRARAAFEELERRAQASGTPWARGLLARSCALLSDDAEADAHYREAIELIGTT